MVIVRKARYMFVQHIPIMYLTYTCHRKRIRSDALRAIMRLSIFACSFY